MGWLVAWCKTLLELFRKFVRVVSLHACSKIEPSIKSLCPDQPGHSTRLINVFAVPLVGNYRLKLSSCGNEDSEQTEYISKLIRVISFGGLLMPSHLIFENLPSHLGG